MRHEQIGSGKEHRVYQSRFPEWVLKKPTLKNQLMFWLFRFNPKIVRAEHEITADALQSTQVLFPKWRVFILPQFNKKFGPFTLNKGYVTAQEKIIEDNSLSKQEIIEILKSEEQSYLLARFDISPDNFMTQDKKLYNVDPTKGIMFSGIMDRLGIMSKQRHHRIRTLIKNDLAKIPTILKNIVK